MPPVSTQAACSANMKSSLLQVLQATLGSEAEDLGFKTMKQLSKPTNFRYAAGSRRVEVGVPQSNECLYIRRRSVKTLKEYLEEPDADEHGERDHSYTFWLAQCIHYGLEFPPTSLDAQRILRKAISEGLKKEPAHLRKLAKDLKKTHIEQYGEMVEGVEENSRETIMLEDEEPAQIIDNNQLIYDEGLDTGVPDHRQSPPQAQSTSKLEVVIPRKSANVTNLEAMQKPIVSIWDFPSDSEDNRISRHGHWTARGESFFDAALTEHINYLYNEAEFDDFREFENESTGSEGIHERLSSRLTSSTATGNDGERPPKKARSATSFRTEKQEGYTSKFLTRVVPPAKVAEEEVGKQSQSSNKLNKKPKKDENRTGGKAIVRVPKNSQDIPEDNSTKWIPAKYKTGSKPSVSRQIVPNSNPAPPRQPKEEKTDRPEPGKQAWRRITHTSNPMAGRRPGSYRLESVPPHHFRDVMTMEVPILGPGQRPQDIPPPRQVPNPDHGVEPPLELQWVAQHQAYKKRKLDDFLAKIPKDSVFAGLEPRVVSDSKGVRVQWA